jgi:hypothetical protein
MRIQKTITILLSALVVTSISTVLAGDFQVPPTITPEAQAAATMFSFENRNVALPLPDDVEGWKKDWEANEEMQKSVSKVKGDNPIFSCQKKI